MKKVFYGWWIVLGSAIMLGVALPAAVAVANLYQAPVTESFNIPNSMFAIVNTIVLGVGIFLSPVVSQMLSKPGNFKKVMTVGIIIYGLGYMGYGIAPNIWVFYILSLFVGGGLVILNVMHANIIVSNWFVEKRGTAISLSLTGLGFGGVIFSQLITALIENVGWRLTYIIYGVIILVVCLSINFFVYKERPEDMGMVALGADKSQEDVISQNVIETGVSMPIKNTMNKGFFIALIIGSVLIGLVLNAGLGQFPPYLSGLHGAAAGATIVSVYSAVGIAGKIALGAINDKFGIVKSIIYSGFVLAISYLLMLLAGNYAIAILAAILFGIGNAIGAVLPPLVVADVYSPKNYGTAYGYTQSALTLGMTVGSLFAAGIADVASFEAAWVVVSILTIIGAMLWIYSSVTSKKFA